MISVVIPAYNAERTLPECLAALQQQSGNVVEVIVADDGSTDNTAVVATEHGARVVQQNRQGPAAARNLGLAQARGEIVMYTDADCVPAPDWVGQMSAPLADEQVAGVKGAYATRQRQVVARLAQLEFEERYALLARHKYIDFFDTYAVALRKSALQAQGSFDTFFPVANNEDVDLAYRLAKGGYKIVFNGKAIVFHRHVAGWRAYMRLKFWRGYWRMQVYRRYPQKMLADSYTPQSLKAQIALAAMLLLMVAGAFAGWVPLWAIIALVVLFILAGWRLMAIAWEKDRVLTAVIPVFTFVRAVAVGLGSVVGALTILRIVPVLRPRLSVSTQPSLERV